MKGQDAIRVLRQVVSGKQSVVRPRDHFVFRIHYTLGHWTSSKLQMKDSTPEPVPPPMECSMKKYCRESQASAVWRTLLVMSPSYLCPY